MKFLESDLEEIIMKTDAFSLYERGLNIEGKKKNQVRIGGYGIADIVTYSKEPISFKQDELDDWIKEITVFELKKDKVSLSAFAQGLEYIKGIQDYFTHTGRDVGDYYWRLALVGREVDINSSLVYLPDLVTGRKGSLRVEIFKYSYDIDGLYFDKVENYSLINKGFGS